MVHFDSRRPGSYPARRVTVTKRSLTSSLSPSCYVYVEGCPYEIVFDRIRDSLDGCEGAVSESELRIILDHEMHPLRREEVLLHEVLHVLTDLGGEPTIVEDQIDRLSRRLYAFLRNNNLIVDDVFGTLAQRWGLPPQEECAKE